MMFLEEVSNIFFWARSRGPLVVSRIPLTQLAVPILFEHPRRYWMSRDKSSWDIPVYPSMGVIIAFARLMIVRSSKWRGVRTLPEGSEIDSPAGENMLPYHIENMWVRWM